MDRNNDMFGLGERATEGVLTLLGSALIGDGIGRLNGHAHEGLLIGVGVGLVLMAMIVSSARNHITLK